MAVFTHLEKQDIEKFLSYFSVGKLTNFEGILEGVDNTNYKIETTNGKYILTIFESRIDPNDLPFFLKFMDYLSQNEIVCPHTITPSPITLKSKPAALFSFLDGRGITPTDITPAICYELGILLGKMHVAGQSFQQTRKNSMSFDAWEQRFYRIGRVAHPYMETLSLLKSNWPDNLPSGAIHADLFPDNIFIKDNHIFGVIDFYFSCTDFLAYDLAIVINAWCFDESNFNKEKFESLINGYQSIRPLTPDEKHVFQILCQGASLRFLSSRLHDYLFHDSNNLVTPKSPDEYIQKLEFHKNVELF